MSLVQALGAAGGVGAFLAFMLAMVRIANNAERRRADDARQVSDEWRQAAIITAKANETNTANLQKLITTVDQLVTSHRELTVLLQAMTTERRDAA